MPPEDAPTRCPRRHFRRAAAVMRLIITLAVIALLALGAFLYFNQEDTSNGQETTLYTVRPIDFDITLTASGDLQAATETVLRSRLETTVPIVEIVDEGIIVEAGDILVRLSGDEIKQRLENEMLTLESARSELVGAENSLEIQRSDNDSNLRAAKLRLKIAEIAFEKWEKGEDMEMTEQLALDIEAAERELERLREKYENSVELHEANFLSRDQLKQDELALLRADASLKKANLRADTYRDYEREMKRVELESEITEATAELDRVNRRNESQLASKLANVTNSKRQVSIREDRVAKLEEQLANCDIKAPTAGLVVYATSLDRGGWRRDDDTLTIGTEVRPNQEIIILPNNEQMIASVKIHESLVGKIRKDQPARVRVDAARGQTLKGTIEGVGVLAESGGWRDPNLRQYDVRVRLDLATQDHDFKPSMRCEAEIITGSVTGSLAVPVEAIFFEQGTPLVYTPHEGKFAPTTVAIGKRSSIYAQITSGLEAGDQVLLREPKPNEIWTDPAAPTQPAVAEDAPRDRPAVSEASF